MERILANIDASYGDCDVEFRRHSVLQDHSISGHDADVALESGTIIRRFACVWPFQRALQSKVPKLIALVSTLLLTLVVLGVLDLAAVWRSGQVGHWLLGNAERFAIIAAIRKR